MTTPLVGSGWLEIPLAGNALFAGGEVAALANPEGHKLIIVDAVLYTKTATTEAGTTLAIGCNAATAATSDNTLVAAHAADAGAGGAVHATIDAADAKDAIATWPADKFLTVTGSASSVAFVGTLFVKYVHAA